MTETVIDNPIRKPDFRPVIPAGGVSGESIPGRWAKVKKIVFIERKNTGGSPKNAFLPNI